MSSGSGSGSEYPGLGRTPGRRRVGGSYGTGLSNGTETRIAKKEKAVSALTDDLSRRAARALARKIVADAQRMAASGTITKAERDSPAGILASKMITWDRQLDDLQAQVEMLAGAIFAERRAQIPKARAAQADAAIAVLNEAEHHMAAIAKAILQEQEADG